MVQGLPSLPLATNVAAILIVSAVGVALLLFLGGLLLFARKGRLYEAWLRWGIKRGRYEEAIAFYRSQDRLEEAGKLMVEAGDIEGAARLYTKLGKPELAAETLTTSGDRNAAAAHYLHAKEYERAAECFVEMGDIERAVRALLEGGEYSSAADVYVEASQPDKAVALLMEADRLDHAAEILIAHGNPERGGDLLAKLGQFVDAAQAYLQAEKPRKAAAAFDRAGKNTEAAKLWVEFGEPLQAASALVRGGRHEEAANLFRAAGALDKAAEALLVAGQPTVAARLLEEAGDELRAAGIYEEAGDAVKAATLRLRAAEKAGRFTEAGEQYAKLGRFDAAADRFARGGDFGRAGEALVRLRRLKDAAAMFIKAGRVADAARSFEEAEAWPEAARCHLRIGNVDAAIADFRKVGDLLTIARVYFKLGSREAALEAVRAVKETSPQYADAAQMHARLLERKGDVEGAKNVLERFLEVKGLSDATVDIACRIAEYEGRLGNAAAAFAQLNALRQANLTPEGFEDQFLFFQESILLSVDGSRPPAQKKQGPTGPRPESNPATPPPPGPEAHIQAVGSLAHPSALRSATITMGFPWIGRYRFMEKLGSGSFGEVFRALDTSLDRIVALKVLLPEAVQGEQFRHMFLKEARVVAKLNHAGIIQVYDIGEFGNRLYIAMEFVDGENLADIMERRRAPLPTPAIHSIARQICEALDYAHGHKIVHRDIKLENAMITPEGRVKLLDFGVAGLLDDPEEGAPVMAGTPHYMAPEVVAGGRVDGRTDLYALGVLLYCLVAARFPFFEGNILEQHQKVAPPDPAAFNPDFPRPFADLILKLMEKDPTVRFQSAREVNEALLALNF